MVYSPQAPTALSNGPTIIEAQVETIVDMVKKLEGEQARSIEAKSEAEAEWKATLDAMSQYTLIRFTDSWWNGYVGPPSPAYDRPSMLTLPLQKCQHPRQEIWKHDLCWWHQHVRASVSRNHGRMEGV